ncbi:unnamed protein product, partial [Ectocarpus sp. 12 AP-2014]
MALFSSKHPVNVQLIGASAPTFHSVRQGALTFEGDATFERNVAHTEGSSEQGKGGAISNTGSGTILFKRKLTMKYNDADASFAALGGAIYNRGEIVVEGESLFSLNRA